MPDLDLHMEIRNGEQVFLTGTKLHGTVRIKSTTPWTAEMVEVVVYWRTSGIGTSDNGIGKSLSLAQKSTEFHGDFTVDFELGLPLEPYSYNGKLIKIQWYLGLRVKKGWLSKQELEIPIEIRPALVDPIA